MDMIEQCKDGVLVRAVSDSVRSDECGGSQSESQIEIEKPPKPKFKVRAPKTLEKIRALKSKNKATKKNIYPGRNTNFRDGGKIQNLPAGSCEVAWRRPDDEVACCAVLKEYGTIQKEKAIDQGGAKKPVLPNYTDLRTEGGLGTQNKAVGTKYDRDKRKWKDQLTLGTANWEKDLFGNATGEKDEKRRKVADHPTLVKIENERGKKQIELPRNKRKVKCKISQI